MSGTAGGAAARPGTGSVAGLACGSAAGTAAGSVAGLAGGPSVAPSVGSGGGLSGARPRWRREADVVVVGSGAAGISVALTAAARGIRVLVVTKDLVGGATPLAQGGLAAALGAGDTPAAHVSDTLIAGAGLCEPEIVSALADGAPGAIEWLTRLGARLETHDLRLEGGHSARRIVHSGDDATGAEVHRTLLAALLASGIEILDRTVALDLLLHSPAGSGELPGREGPLSVAVARDGAGTGTGARAMDGTAAANADPVGPATGGPVPARWGTRDRVTGDRGGGHVVTGDWGTGDLVTTRWGGGRVVTGLAAAFIGADGRLTPGIISARAVVIATGGLGQAFGTTSNPAGATGDGIAIAARAGAVIRDLEFVQFHPTVLWLPNASGQCPLITEALRGAGAVLRDLDGTPLMAGHDPRGDLAPRDVIAARMAEVISAGSTGHVWLDATELGRDLMENGFPTVTGACRKHGIDPVTEMIPVAPGAHYSCGGILAGLDGRTSLAGLYAAGEAASTGVQGANRLASNSVTEALIAGRRTGAAVADALARDALARDEHEDQQDRDRHGPVVRAATGTGGWHEFTGSGEESGAGGRAALAQAMSRYAGVMRDGDGLTRLLEVITETGGRCSLAAPGGSNSPEDHEPGRDLDLESVEAANLRAVSLLIVVGARRRAESRGCHRRRDAVGSAPPPWHTLTRWDGHKLVVTKEAL